MAFPHDSIRDLMNNLDKEGELVRIKEEVDWNLEAAAITRRANEIGHGRSVKNGGQPMMLFENIKGYPKGFSILGNIVTNYKQVAIVLGHPKPDEASVRDLQDRYLEGVEHPVKPVLVKDGPCKENKAFGDDVNLYKFPAPMIHAGDGGRYLGTYSFVASKDKFSDWVNWGMYRNMVHDRRSLGVLSPHGQHLGNMYHGQYEPADELMPVAIAINPDPLSSFVAGSPVPHLVSEVDVVGGFRKKPLEVVKCETNDLFVPASSEIVIEGVIPPRLRAYEGPYGEYTGFRASPRDLRPVIVVRCMTWRNNPILSMSNMGMPVSESNIVTAIGRGALYRKALIDAGWPVKDVSAAGITAVSVRRGRPRVAQGIMSVLTSMTGGQYTGVVVVCDDDMDVFNISDVWTSIALKVHPERGVTVYHQPGNPLAPYADLRERMTMTGPQLLLDATWPLDWPPEIAVPPKVSFKEVYPKEIQDKVLSKWNKYGLK